MAVQNATTKNTTTQYKKPEMSAKIAGALAGYTAFGTIVSTTSPQISRFCQEQMQQLQSSIPQDTFETVRKGMGRVIEETGLLDKGVRLIKAGEENREVVSEILSSDLNRGIARFLPKSYKDMQKQCVLRQVEEGANAFFSQASNTVVVPKKGIELAFFHEVGHALNANKSTLTKILQKCRPLIILATPILLIGLLKDKKAPDEKPKNKLDKATTFIKENAGKLSFAAFVPMLLEEGLASLRGNKLSKQFFDSDIAKNVAKSNGYGFLSYLGMATAFSVGTVLAIKIRDSIAAPKKTYKKENTQKA